MTSNVLVLDQTIHEYVTKDPSLSLAMTRAR